MSNTFKASFGRPFFYSSTMSKVRVGINGFGRIGRVLARALAEDERIDLVAINDIYESDVLTHLFKYDSVHGRLGMPAHTEGGRLIFGRQKATWFKEKNAEQIPWGAHKVDIVIDCTGINKTIESASVHLKSGAGKVIVSAPPDDDRIKAVVIGINDSIINAEDLVISNASCTTNCAAPMIKVLDDLCGLEACYITTVHSYTGDQRLHDSPHKDWRRARAAAESIVPTSTGAAKAIYKIFPHLKGELGGCGMRVPVPDGSLTDITCIVNAMKTTEEINSAFRSAASGYLRGVLEYTEDPIVSRDVIGNPASCLFDAQLTSVVGRMVKVVGWYDNEVGYSNRLVDLALKIGS